MATSLNKPADFGDVSDSKTVDGQTVKLLPPSCFESGIKADPWRELVSATSEILNLKQQNQQLRNSKQVNFTAGEEIKARVDLHQPSAPLLQTSQLDGIINRQATEVSELRQRLQTTEGQYQRQVARLESQILIKDAEKKQEVTSLQQTIQRLTIEHETEIKKESDAHKQKCCGQENKIAQLESQMFELNRSSKQTEEDLALRLKTLQDEFSLYQHNSQQQISDYEKSVQDYKSQLDQHKKYISESEEASKSTQIWRTEMETLKNNIQILQSEKSNLESSLQLLNIRLKSQNDIQVIQDQQLSQVKDGGSEKKKAVLLTRWREKVFQLLVQLESAHITQKDIERNHSYQVCNLKEDLEGQRNMCELLQHKLTDMQAQVDIEKHIVQTLESELTSAQQLAIELDDRNKQYQVTIGSLVDFANGMYEKCCASEKNLLTVQSQLEAYNKRITFASGRIEMLQSQFARKEALLRVQLEERYNEKPTKDISDPFTETQTENILSQLTSELEKVQRERDSLAAQIKQDAASLEDRTHNARQQVADEVEQLRKRANELHQTIEDQNKKIQSLQELHDTSEGENTEYITTIEQLQIELGKVQVQHEKDLEECKREEESLVTEQLADMEHRLNEARREHTKAVVSLRQLERQTERDKQRMNEERNKMDGYYKQHIVKLEQNIKSLESDRNLLMTTLRQEGLVGKYKEQRGTPVTLEDSQLSELEELQNSAGDMNIATTSQELNLHTEGVEGVSHHPLTSSRDTFFEDTGEMQEQSNASIPDGVDHTDVLEELKHLSEEVLQDSDDLSDS